MKRYAFLTDPQKFQINFVMLLCYLIKKSGTVELWKLTEAQEVLKKLELDPEKLEAMNRTLAFAMSIEIDPREIGGRITVMTNYAERLTVLKGLFRFAREIGMSRSQREDALMEINRGLKLWAFELQILEYDAQKGIPAQYYFRLGLKPGASKVAVKQAYRRLALKFHPDRVGHLNEASAKLATEKFQKINEAYAELLKG